MRKRKSQIERKAIEVFEKIKVKYASLSVAKQITLVGAILGCISLFFPWIIKDDTTVQTWNAFHSLTGNIGYILVINFAIQIFLTLSETYKEKLKLYSDIDFKNHFLIIISGLFSIILSVVAISFAVGLSYIGQYIEYGNGPVLCIVAGILILAGGIYIRLEDKRNSSEIILQKLSENRKKNKKQDNMELPF